MLESLTADSIFSQIMMDENNARAFLLVEGPDENSIFFGHTSNDIELIVCGGKKNVLGAAEAAEANSQTNVYGLVDSDFDRFQDKAVTYPKHVVATEAYDLIADIVLSSPALLRRVLSAHGADCVEKIERVSGKNIDRLVFELTTKLAAAKLAAKRYQYEVSFREYDFKTLLDQTFKVPDLSDILEHAARRAPRFVPEQNHHDAVERAFFEVDGHRQASGGHDVVSASVALLQRGGTKISKKTISGTFISTATCQALLSITCLKYLSKLAMQDSGVSLFECSPESN